MEEDALPKGLAARPLRVGESFGCASLTGISNRIGAFQPLDAQPGTAGPEPFRPA